MARTSRRILISMVALALSAGTMGAQCGSSSPSSSSSSGSGTGTSTSSSSSSGGTNPGGTTTVSSSGLYAQMTPPAGVTAYLHQASSFLSQCIVPSSDIAPIGSTPSGNSNNDLVCILDAAEGDLYLQGMTLNFNAPPGVCDYAIISYYWFWNFQPGAPGNISYCTSTAAANLGTILGTPTVNNGSLGPKGGYTCTYDYSHDDYDGVPGPNCCEGTYTQNVQTSPDGTAGSCGNTQTSVVTYGGQAANCVVGPATYLSTRRTEDGIPEPTFYTTPVTGMNTSIAIKPPDASNFGTNLTIANYFNPALNGGNPPTALQAAVGDQPEPYYELDCLDSGYDILARVRVQIRSWDTVAGFTAESNPYTAGDESGFGGTHPWHNFEVWQDLETGFPDDGL